MESQRVDWTRFGDPDGSGTKLCEHHLAPVPLKDWMDGWMNLVVWVVLIDGRNCHPYLCAREDATRGTLNAQGAKIR